MCDSVETCECGCALDTDEDREFFAREAAERAEYEADCKARIVAINAKVAALEAVLELARTAPPVKRARRPKIVRVQRVKVEVSGEPVKAATDPTDADEWRGAATAAVSTLGVVDRDRDLILPGSLEGRPTLVNGSITTVATAIVSEWNHSAMKGDVPVGRARVREEGDRLVADIVWDDTERGRAACERVYAERPDWSLGYAPVQEREPTADEKARGARRVIVRWRIGEVSPVDKGAGVSTGTYAACCGTCATEIARRDPAADTSTFLGA